MMKRTTITIEADTLGQLMGLTAERTPQDAIRRAVQELLRHAQRGRLVENAGATKAARTRLRRP